MTPGYFVVCEGLDAAGKTTSMKHALTALQQAGIEAVYSKGLQTQTFAGRISRCHPSTYTLLGEIAYIDWAVVRPALERDGVVLQDRWFYSVLTHHPLNFPERLFGQLLVPCISKPDLLIHFTVSLEERIARLSARNEPLNPDGLLRDPRRITEREERFLYAYAAFPGEKEIIDTTGKTAEESG
jgi:thymidylate kinase